MHPQISEDQIKSLFQSFKKHLRGNYLACIIVLHWVVLPEEIAMISHFFSDFIVHAVIECLSNYVRFMLTRKGQCPWDEYCFY